MQTEITQTIIQRIPLLSSQQQQEILVITDRFLNEKKIISEHPLIKLIKENQFDSGITDLATNFDKYKTSF